MGTTARFVIYALIVLLILAMSGRELVPLFILIMAASFVLVVILRIVWRVGTTDWFGLYYDDPTSPYYHDKTGQGRGR